MNKTEIFKLSRNFIRITRKTVDKALQYSFRDKRNTKGLWFEHINTGSCQHGKLWSHMDNCAKPQCLHPRCLHTMVERSSLICNLLDTLQPSLKRLKVEESFGPVVPETETCQSSIRSVVPNHALRASASTLRQQEDRRCFRIAAMERRRREMRDQMNVGNRRTPRKSKNHALENSKSDKSCQLCASSEKLLFEPPKIVCTSCDTRIKRNRIYFTFGNDETGGYFCKPCYNQSQGDRFFLGGASILKTELEKKKNDEKTEEWWIQCDKCKAWQHQICALYNGERNEAEQAQYICPNCVEKNERKQSDVLGAKDLPRTILSDHIEQRLFKRLKEERIERAKLQETTYDEIPSAESLVVRVVSSVDKKLEVRSRFCEYFREDNFPTEFPYKSKMIMLFQKIEGVEVCLLAQHVQEFGSECSFPNQRSVYLAFLDSVKYFRPDIKSAYGESLRTFVYQEILISYLEYCKLRGFTSCYLWSCPPLKKVDYILYCHPKIQKTPNPKKLQKWHLAWLRKAAKEGIVVKTTNLYDHFFLQTGECRAKVTAARLPYFFGYYWSRKAEDIIYKMSQEDDDKKGNKNGDVTGSALKADVSENVSKDQRLMQKLGETIRPMKNELIVVHLHHYCNHCSTVMVTGNRWVCSQCKNFQLCDGCYEAEQKREDSERHPLNHKKKHDFSPVKIDDISVDTRDRDEILESYFTETGYKFLKFCEKRHCQYDTLRRAKYSSKVVIHHLHQEFKRDCNACGLDIDYGQGYRCKGCNYDLCNACYNKEGIVNHHPHKLTNLSARNKEARQHVL